MEKVFRILKPGEDEEALDLEFWASRTPLECLEAVEILREHYAFLTHETESRLQRTARILQRT